MKEDHREQIERIVKTLNGQSKPMKKDYEKYIERIQKIYQEDRNSRNEIEKPKNPNDLIHIEEGQTEKEKDDNSINKWQTVKGKKKTKKITIASTKSSKSYRDALICSKKKKQKDCSEILKATFSEVRRQTKLIETLVQLKGGTNNRGTDNIILSNGLSDPEIRLTNKQDTLN